MKPDFSGEYVLNRGTSTLSAAGAVNVQSASLRIKHDEPNFSCMGKFAFANAKPVEWAFELVATDVIGEDEISIFEQLMELIVGDDLVRMRFVHLRSPG